MRPDALLQAREVETVDGAQLGQQLVGPLDGTGHELREEAHVRREQHEVARGLDAAAVDVDRVAHLLERVEGDAHRQQHVEVRHREARVAQQRPQRVQREVRVLEVGEDAEVRGEARQQVELARPRVGAAVHGERRPVVDERRGRDQVAVPRLPVAVEDVARDEHQQHARAPGQQVVRRDRQRQERQVLEADEGHGRGASGSSGRTRSARAAASVRWPSSARWMCCPSRNWRQGTAPDRSHTSKPWRSSAGAQARVPVDVGLQAEVVRLQHEDAARRQAGGGLAEHLHELRPRRRRHRAGDRLGLHAGSGAPSRPGTTRPSRPRARRAGTRGAFTCRYETGRSRKR